MFRTASVVILGAALLAACAPPARPSGTVGQPADGGAVPPPTVRNLTVGVRYELPSLSAKALSLVTSVAQKRLFNAQLTLMDSGGAIRPYLAEALPQVDTDSWRVFPDGRMETTYRLRPNLTWHDGHPLTADDFAFALQVYTKPGLGYFIPNPQDRIEEVLAQDPRVVVIRWRSLYPDAGSLRWEHFDPLPRHLLGPMAEASDPDAVRSHAYWTNEYVGAGPFALVKWEPGSFLETTAFEGHALGRPRIDRLTVRIVPDDNTMLTNVLAGNVDVSLDNSLRYEHAVVLKREWGPTNQGIVIFAPIQPRTANFQRRTDLANPRALLDLRVRRALAHAVDKQGIIDGLFEGEQVPLADQLLPPTMPYFAELDRAVVKYPYDLRRAEQYMTDAGFRRAGDGVYADTSERMSFTLISGGGTQNEKERAVLADGWRRAGFEVAESILPPSLSPDPEYRATWPSVHTSAAPLGEAAISRWTSAQIGTPANRWRGSNAAGWSNSEYDRLYDAFNSTLDRADRDRQVVQMMRVLTEDVGALFFFHNPSVIAHTATLSGPQVGAPDHLIGWNVHEWQLR